MEMRQVMVHDVLNVVPRLQTLRRVPRQYWHYLPLQVMKRHQCIVIGGEAGSLTVAIADCRRSHVVAYLRLLTGCAIFPVQVDPIRIRLLIKRVERIRQARYKFLKQSALYRPLALHAMVAFFHAYSDSR
jgi:hypothetical protein